MGDALGTVRQLSDFSPIISLALSYEPFGDPATAVGTASSIYGFAGEQGDRTGLVYLRSRYLRPSSGGFLTRDTWEGDPNRPMSYNLWLYVFADPVNHSDPSGLCLPTDDACNQRARDIVEEFPSVQINLGNSLFGSALRLPWIATYWTEDELTDVQRGLRAISTALDAFGPSEAMFPDMFGTVVLTRMTVYPGLDSGGFVWPLSSPPRVVILDLAVELGVVPHTAIHELGHVLDGRGPGGDYWDIELLSATGGSCIDRSSTGSCSDYEPGGVTTVYGASDLDEDFADSFYAFVRLFSLDEGFDDPGEIDSTRVDFFADLVRSYR